MKKSFIVFAFCLVALFSYAQFTNDSNVLNHTMSSDNSLKSGYRGMIEIGYGAEVGQGSEGRFEIQTIHGYQLNPYLFSGIGAGFSCYHDSDMFSVPVFADIRSLLPLHHGDIAPFIDIKVGYAFADVRGFYFSPAIGMRVALNKRVGFNVSIGYEIQRYNWTFSYTEPYTNTYFSAQGTDSANALSVKIGFDF